MLDELAHNTNTRDNTTIPLNRPTRAAAPKQQEKIQTDFRARHVAIDGSDAALIDVDKTLDDGLNANERSIKSELKEEKDAKKAKDAVLDETAHILFDAIGLIKADPKVASEVLPYGGKFSTVASADVPAAPKGPVAEPAVGH
jgi:carboxyl-terminal processing protease